MFETEATRLSKGSSQSERKKNLLKLTSKEKMISIERAMLRKDHFGEFNQLSIGKSLMY